MNCKFNCHGTVWELTDYAIIYRDEVIILSDIELESFSCSVPNWCTSSNPNEYYSIGFRNKNDKKNRHYHVNYPYITKENIIGHIEQYASVSNYYIKQKAEKRKRDITSKAYKIFGLAFIVAAVYFFFVGLPKGDMAMWYSLGVFLAIGIAFFLFNIYMVIIVTDWKAEAAIGAEIRKNRKTIDEATRRQVLDKDSKRIIKGAVIGGVIAGPAGAVVGAIVESNKNKKS